MEILTKAQWATVLAGARGEGYEGDSIEHEDSRRRLIDYLKRPECPEFKLRGTDGKTIKVDAKALGIEMSDDKKQVLITEGAGEDPNAQQPPPPPNGGNGNGNGQMALDPRTVEAKIKAEVEKALGAKAGKRPDMTTAISGVKSTEEADYERRAKRGQTFFSNYTDAKMAALALSCALLGGTSDENHAVVNGATLAKMAGSTDVASKRFGESSDSQIKAMASSPQSAGGAFLRTEYSNDVLRNVEEYGFIPSVVNIIRMNERDFTLPRRTSGNTVYYPEENSDTTQSDVGVANDKLVAKDAAVLTRASRAVLRDARPALVDLIMLEQAHALAQHIDDAVMKGDGSSTYAGRIGLTHFSGAQAPYGTSASDGGRQVVGGDTASAHTATHLASFRGRIPLYARKNTIITGDPAVLDGIFLRLAQGLGGLGVAEWQGEMVNSWSGHPLVPNFSMKNTALDASGDAIDLLGGDINRAVAVGIREETGFERDDSVGFVSNSVYFRMILSWDFALRDTGTSSKAGPLVAFLQT